MSGFGTYFSRYCVWKGAAEHPGCEHLNVPVGAVATLPCDEGVKLPGSQAEA